MNINMPFSSNPYEGARRAFLGLNPGSTDAEWEEFCGQMPPEEMTSEDELIELAALCHAGAKNKTGIFSEEEIELFCFSAGVFEALIVERFWDRRKAA
jgi:hypothetical protein